MSKISGLCDGPLSKKLFKKGDCESNLAEHSRTILIFDYHSFMGNLKYSCTDPAGVAGTHSRIPS